MAVRVFLSYAHEDATGRDAVLKHLGWLRHTDQLVHSTTGQIKPGRRSGTRDQGRARWRPTLSSCSSRRSFVGSRYCTGRACGRVERAEGGAGRELVPIVCDHVDLVALPPIRRPQCLPQDEKNDLNAAQRVAEPEQAARRDSDQGSRMVGRSRSRAARAARARRLRSVRLAGASRSRRRVASGERTRPSGWSRRCSPSRPARRWCYGGPGMGKTTVTLEAACDPDVVGAVRRAALRRGAGEGDGAGGARGRGCSRRSGCGRGANRGRRSRGRCGRGRRWWCSTTWRRPGRPTSGGRRSSSRGWRASPACGCWRRSGAALRRPGRAGA